MKSNEYLACMASALFFFYSIASLSFFNVISQGLIQEFGLSTTQLGLLSSGYLYANALWLIPAGFLFDRLSTRRLMLLAMLLDVVGIFLTCLSHNVLEILIGRVLSGTASAFVLLGTVRTGVKLFPGHHAGKAIGFMISFGVFGGCFGNLFFSKLSPYFNWHITTLLFGILGLFIFIFMAIFQMDTEAKIKRHKEPILQNLILILKNKTNWLGGLYIGLMNLPVFLLASLWGEIYLTKIQNISASSAAQVSGLIFIGVMVGSSTFGYLSDRMGLRKPLLLVGALLAIVFMLLLIFTTPPCTPLYAGSLFFLIGFSITSQVIIYPLLAEKNPIRVISLAQGLASTINNLIGAIMQAVFGYIIMAGKHHINGANVYDRGGFNNGLLVLTVAFCLAIAVSCVLKETFCRRVD